MSPLEIIAVILLCWIGLRVVLYVASAYLPWKTPLEDCKGDYALITGASQGLGLHLSLECARRGLHPILIARNEELLKKAVDRIQHTYPLCMPMYIVADLTDKDQYPRILNTLRTLEKPVSILLSNLGGQGSRWHPGPFHKTELGKVFAVFELNGTPLYRLTHALLPSMIRNGRGGIMAISSLSYKYMPYLSAYATEKAKVNAFMRCIQQELAGSGTNVVAQSMVAGGIWTPGLQKYITENAQAQGKSRTDDGPGFAAPHPKYVAKCFMDNFGKGGAVRVPYWSHWILQVPLDWLVPEFLQNVVINKIASGVTGVTTQDFYD
jgi:hypothetical protein